MSTAINKNEVDNGAVKAAPKSCLIPKIVKIRPTPIRRNGTFITGTNQERVRSESIMLTGTGRSIICPIDGVTGRLVNPFKSLEERSFLEEQLGVNLDVNKPDKNKLYEMRLEVVKTTDDIDSCYRELNLEDPFDFILYRIAQVSPDVALAKNPKGLYKPNELLYIDDEEVEQKNDKEENDMEDYCLGYIMSIKESKAKIWNVLRMYNTRNHIRKVYNKELSIDYLYNELKELAKDKKHLYNVYKLVKLIKEDTASYETQILIQDAISIGEISWNTVSNDYKFVDGTFAGKDLNEVEIFLRNPVNQTLRQKVINQCKAILQTK